MLPIIIPAITNEFWDEEKNEFVYRNAEPEKVLHLEHSLIAVSLWESKWKKSFFSKDEKSREEILDYIKFMTLDTDINESLYERITDDNIKAVLGYMKDPMTATTFSDSKKQKTNTRNRRRITSELIYYWMFSFGIPIECEKWHMNRLMTLIHVCEAENSPPGKKMSHRELARRNTALNAARKKRLNTKG